MPTARQTVAQPGPDGKVTKVEWPWKTGQRATFPRTGEQVVLFRVEPPTLGVRYQLRHRSLDNISGRPYRWKGRAWSLASLMSMIERGWLRIDPMPARRRPGRGSRP